MSDRDYEKLFDLIEKIVNDTSAPWKERAAAVRAAAEANGAETALEEFTGWFQE